MSETVSHLPASSVTRFQKTNIERSSLVRPWSKGLVVKSALLKRKGGEKGGGGGGKGREQDIGSKSSLWTEWQFYFHGATELLWFLVKDAEQLGPGWNGPYHCRATIGRVERGGDGAQRQRHASPVNVSTRLVSCLGPLSAPPPLALPSPHSFPSPIPSNSDAMPVHALLPLLLHAVLILFFRFVWLWNCLAGALASPLRNERQRSLSLSVRSSSLYWSSLFSCLRSRARGAPVTWPSLFSP